MPRIPGRLRLAVFAALAVVASTVLTDATPPAAAQFSPRLPATQSAGTRVDVGFAHGCAVTPTGGVQCWGMNQFGQLGDGTTTFRETPVTVQLAASARAVAVAVGDRHSCALLATGDVMCWGDDSVGQLGAGAGDDSGGPIGVDLPGANPAVALSAGPLHTCVISHIGSPLCWGQSHSGAVVDAPQPELLPGGAKAVAISTHLHHSCAVTDAGSVSCWGVNTYGQFGTNATSSAFASPSGPVMLAGGQRAVGVSVGEHTTCAVSDTGEAQCWGRNYVGQVGDGTTTDRWVPTPVALPGPSRATAVVAGSLFGCAVLDTGIIACWGDNSRGQHGDTSLAGRVTALATSHQSVCAVLDDGRITCWGDNTYAQLGGGTTGGSSATPTTPRTPGSTHMIAHIGAGSAHSCALNTQGDVWCWGENTLGQLGTGLGDNTTAPGAPVVLPGVQRAKELAVGYQHTCALLTDGNVSCWGSNVSGQVGDNSFIAYTPAQQPVALPGVGRAKAIAAGGEHTCALLVDGDIACWGNNDYGQLGGGAMLGGGAPNLVTLPVAGVKALSVVAGGHHTCAVLTNGVMTCWGYNARSQLGDGTTVNRNSPVTLSVSPAALVVAMAAGHEHTCALLAGGNVTCWGSNQWGQLGVLPSGINVTLTAPTGTVSLPGSLRATAVSAAGFLTCVVLGNGTVNCWGYNGYGAVGDGTWNSPANLPTPGAVHGGGKRIRSLAVGTFHACAVLDDGTATCWGLNDQGQVGDGTTTNRAAPTHITLPEPAAMSADPGDTTVQLTWTEPRSPYGPQTWQVEGSSDDTTWWSATAGPVSAASATLSAVTVSGLTNGTDYRFRIVSTTPVRTATVTLAAMVTPLGAPDSTPPPPPPSPAETLTTEPFDDPTVTPPAPPTAAQIAALPLRTMVDPTTLRVGATVTVAVTGFTPGQTVMVMVASTPQVLDMVTADDDGALRARVLIPSDLGAGEHTLAVWAPDSGVGFRQRFESLDDDPNIAPTPPDPVVDPTGPLPATGTDPHTLLLTALLCCAVGWTLKRRRGAGEATY